MSLEATKEQSRLINDYESKYYSNLDTIKGYNNIIESFQLNGDYYRWLAIDNKIVRMRTFYTIIERIVEQARHDYDANKITPERFLTILKKQFELIALKKIILERTNPYYMSLQPIFNESKEDIDRLMNETLNSLGIPSLSDLRSRDLQHPTTLMYTTRPRPTPDGLIPRTIHNIIRKTVELHNYYISQFLDIYLTFSNPFSVYQREYNNLLQRLKNQKLQQELEKQERENKERIEQEREKEELEYQKELYNMTNKYDAVAIAPASDTLNMDNKSTMGGKSKRRKSMKKRKLKTFRKRRNYKKTKREKH